MTQKLKTSKKACVRNSSQTFANVFRTNRQTDTKFLQTSRIIKLYVAAFFVHQKQSSERHLDYVIDHLRSTQISNRHHTSRRHRSQRAANNNPLPLTITFSCEKDSIKTGISRTTLLDANDYPPYYHTLFA